MDKVDSDIGVEHTHQAAFYPKTDPRLPIEISRFTLPSIWLPLEEVITIQMPALKQRMEYDFSIFETSPISMIVQEPLLDTRGVEQIVTLKIPRISGLLDVEDDEAFTLQTVSIRVVKKKRARNRAGVVLSNSAVSLLSILFLSLLIAIIVVVPGVIYKLQLLLVLLIGFSYSASSCLKHIRKARQQKYLTITQFLQATKKAGSSPEDDMKHLKLLKQDTIIYLRALTTKDLKKGVSE